MWTLGLQAGFPHSHNTAARCQLLPGRPASSFTARGVAVLLPKASHRRSCKIQAREGPGLRSPLWGAEQEERQKNSDDGFQGPRSSCSAQEVPHSCSPGDSNSLAGRTQGQSWTSSEGSALRSGHVRLTMKQWLRQVIGCGEKRVEIPFVFIS